MKTLLKTVLGLAGLVVVMAIALAVTVALLFDPKDYQPLLAESVEKATGRKLTLSGDLGLSLFPCCSITLGRTALSNPPGYPAGDFASVDSAALSIKLWPLLVSREVQIGVLRLQGLNANLLVRADGAANWEFEAGAPAAAGAGDEGGPTGQPVIEGIEIRDGRVAYRDAQDESGYLVEQLEFETGNIAAGRPFDLSLSAKITEQAHGSAATITLKSRATLDAEASRLTLAKPLVDIAASGSALPAKSLVAKLGAAELVIETKQDTKLAFRDLQGEFTMPGLEALAGDVEGSFVADEARLEIGGSTEVVMPKLAADFTVSGAQIPGDVITAKLQATGVSADVDKALGAVETFAADINGIGARLAVTGSGRVTDNGANLAGTLTLDPVSPRSLLAVLKEPEPKTADPTALTRLAGTADWALAKGSLRLPKLDFQLDQTRLAGSLGVANFDKPMTTFNLRLDAIDLDRYLEPDSAVQNDSESGAGGEEGSDIPVETIRDLRLDGRVQIGELTFARAKLAGVSANVRAADGKLRLDPLAATLYGGEYRGAVTIDAAGPTAQVALDQQISAIQVGGALRDLYQTDKLTGALTGRINASGSGNTSDDLLKTLDGNVALNLADGAYLGTDLWHEIRTARARLKGEAPPAAPAEPRTPLQAMQLAGNIANGVLRTDQLLAEVPFIRLTGAGALDLVGKTMDYRLQAQVFETPTFEDGSTIKDLKGITIPLTLKGPMEEPKVGVEIKDLAAGVATQKLRDRLFEKLGGGEPEPAAELDGAATGTTRTAPKEEKPRDALKRSLRDLLKPQQ